MQVSTYGLQFLIKIFRTASTELQMEEKLESIQLDTTAHYNSMQTILQLNKTNTPAHASQILSCYKPKQAVTKPVIVEPLGNRFYWVYLI